MTKTSKLPQVNVIGAGMSGLLTAYYLSERGFSVQIYEKDEDVGGKIRTYKSPLGFMESAANAILADAEVEAVAKTIGIELISARQEASRRYIFKKKKLRRWPLGLWATWRLILFVIRRFLKPARFEPSAGQTLEAWGLEHLGRETVDYLLTPACLGIFGAESSHLSARLVLSYFFPKFRRRKGRLRGSVAPVGGMGDWSRGLRRELQQRGVVFHMGKPVLSRGLLTKPLVLATDMKSAQKFLEDSGDARARVLEKVPTVDLLSINAFFRSSIDEKKQGFGVLFPPREKQPILGLLQNSVIFDRPSQKTWSETWILGGVSPSSAVRTDSGRLLSTLRELRRKLFDDGEEPLEWNINSWPEALPLYGLELETALERLRLENDQIYLMGNYLGEIGLNRLFHRARELAAQIYQEHRSF